MCGVIHTGNDAITYISYFYQGLTFDTFISFHMDNKGTFLIIIKILIVLKLQTNAVV